MNLNLFNSPVIHGHLWNGHVLNCNILDSLKPLICQIDPLPLGKGITDFGLRREPFGKDLRLDLGLQWFDPKGGSSF